jgi:hypothetical protein
MTSKPIYFCVYRITNLVEKKHYYGYKSSSVQRKFWYYTPIGIFDHCRALEEKSISKLTLWNWCKNNEKEISIHNYSHSSWLSSNYTWEEIKGKTFKDLGFALIAKT